MSSSKTSLCSAFFLSLALMACACSSRPDLSLSQTAASPVPAPQEGIVFCLTPQSDEYSGVILTDLCEGAVVTCSLFYTDGEGTVHQLRQSSTVSSSQIQYRFTPPADSVAYRLRVTMVLTDREHPQPEAVTDQYGQYGEKLSGPYVLHQNGYSYLASQWEPPFPVSEDVFYVTQSGSKYHRAGCRYAASGSPLSRAECEARGYEPCSICMDE